MDVPEDVSRENKLHTIAERQNIRLEKGVKSSGGSDTYTLIDAGTGTPIIDGGAGFGDLTLDEVERRLTVERFVVPPGASFTIPADALHVSAGEQGEIQLRITEVHSSVQTWPDWLSIAAEHGKAARAARNRLESAVVENDKDAESEALTAEFRGSLQSMTASVIALDGFYGTIQDMVLVSGETREQRKKNRVGRAVWVADAIIQASDMPNVARKTLTKDIHTAYKARDTAVHPGVKTGRFARHPALPGALVPQLYADFIVEASRGLFRVAVEAIMWVTDHPQLRNAAVTAYAPIASEMLHRVVDPLITINPDSPLARKSSNPLI